MSKWVFFLIFVVAQFYLEGLWAKDSGRFEKNMKPEFLIGESDLKYFGLKVYHIELWSERVQFSYAQKSAIIISYNMNFAKDDLVKRSILEIERNHILAASEREFYQQELLKVFNSVKKGDKKTAIFLPNQGVEIYHNDQFVGKISDLKLARFFVDIWLDERSSFAEVTKKLLGKSGN